MDSARKMLMEDGALFEWLFEANPLSQETVRRYRSFLNVAAGGDINVLVQRAQWWWKKVQPRNASEGDGDPGKEKNEGPHGPVNRI